MRAVKNPLKLHRQPEITSSSADIPVRSGGDLKKQREIDDYKHSRQVADPMFDFISGTVKALPWICLLAIVYLIWYYIFSERHDITVIATAATHILVYIAGIVSAAINDAVKRPKD